MTYKPISCDFYDELEALASLGSQVHIHFFDETQNKVCTESKIRDFQIIDKVEFMILHSGELIRLDRLISVNNLQLSDWKKC